MIQEALHDEMLTQKTVLSFVALSIFIAGMVFLSTILSDDIFHNSAPVPYAVDEKILLLFWSNLWGVPAKRSKGVLEKGNERGQCPVACEVTSDHMTSYGACLRNKQGLNKRYETNFKKSKQLLQKTYKFAITFFNQDCDYFVDDQILHALNAGAVPIVMSTDKIYDFLPGNLRNSIINVRDFKNPGELAEHAFTVEN